MLPVGLFIFKNIWTFDFIENCTLSMIWVVGILK